MTTDFKTALIEAGVVTTSPERLQQLSEWNQPEECNRLRRIIASNPNTEDKLLSILAVDYPLEVNNNHCIMLREISDENCWDTWNLASMLSLLLAAGADTSTSLKYALKNRFAKIREGFSELIEIESSETWCYGRTVEMVAAQDIKRVPFDFTMKVELDAKMQATDTVWLEPNENLMTSFSVDWLNSLIDALQHECIEDLFECFGCRDTLRDIPMDETAWEEVRITVENPQINIFSNAIVLASTGEELFEVKVFYWANKEAQPYFDDDGRLVIPVYEHYESEDTGYSRGNRSDLGVLEALWGWQPRVIYKEADINAWSRWLSELVLG